MNAESKRQSMEWKHPRLAKTMKIQIESSTGIVMLTVFWDPKGPIMEDYLEKGSTINSANYSEMMTNKLKPAIRTKRRGLLSKQILLHDNARPHTAIPTFHTIEKLGFEVLKHLTYSPDLAPSEYYLSGLLKDDSERLRTRLSICYGRRSARGGAQMTA